MDKFRITARMAVARVAKLFANKPRIEDIAIQGTPVCAKG